MRSASNGRKHAETGMVRRQLIENINVGLHLAATCATPTSVERSRQTTGSTGWAKNPRALAGHVNRRAK